MPAGTLCISKSATEGKTYRVIFIGYDTTPPKVVTLEGDDGLRSFLEATGLDESNRDRAAHQASEEGFVLLSNIDVTREWVEPQAV